MREPVGQKVKSENIAESRNYIATDSSRLPTSALRAISRPA
jgi:hypothetical protein